MKREAALEILANLEVGGSTPIPTKDVFWWNDVFAAINLAREALEKQEEKDFTIEDLETALYDAKETIEDLRSDIKDLEEELEDAKSDIRDLEDTIDDLRDEIRDYKETLYGGENER
jgi:peptidoglycan hydrolase CwlO-like protein